MSAIEEGLLIIEGHRSGSRLSVSFDIENVDLTGKTLRCFCVTAEGAEPTLTFIESDGSLAKIVKSETLTSVELIKSAVAMLIPSNTYILTIIAYSTQLDTDTIMSGSLEIIDQPTPTPVS